MGAHTVLRIQVIRHQGQQPHQAVEFPGGLPEIGTGPDDYWDALPEPQFKVPVREPAGTELRIHGHLSLISLPGSYDTKQPEDRTGEEPGPQSAASALPPEMARSERFSPPASAACTHFG